MPRARDSFSFFSEGNLRPQFGNFAPSCLNPVASRPQSEPRPLRVLSSTTHRPGCRRKYPRAAKNRTRTAERKASATATMSQVCESAPPGRTFATSCGPFGATRSLATRAVLTPLPLPLLLFRPHVCGRAFVARTDVVARTQPTNRSARGWARTTRSTRPKTLRKSSMRSRASAQSRTPRRSSRCLPTHLHGVLGGATTACASDGPSSKSIHDLSTAAVAAAAAAAMFAGVFLPPRSLRRRRAVREASSDQV